MKEPENQAMASGLVDLLGLAQPPIAIDFVQDASSAQGWDQPPVAASCVFWIHAIERTFTTLRDDHHCSVGRFTHGLSEASEIVDQPDVAALLDVGWVTLETFAEVAHVSDRPTSITYGPLAEAASIPHVVLLRLNAKQLMAISEAVEIELSGKPQCQILPRAIERQVIAASMGCALSRARTGMRDDELTCAVPGGRLRELVDALTSVRRADDAVVAFAEAQA